MRMNVKIWLSLWLLLLYWPVQAAEVDNLYSVELAVPDQSTSVRLEAFRQAFREVIVKVTGNEQVLSNPALQRPLKSSARYVREFRYLQREVTPESEAVQKDSPLQENQQPEVNPQQPTTPDAMLPLATSTAQQPVSDSQLFLRVTFNQDALENLLRTHQIAIWGRQRPSTLLLVAMEIDDQPRIISGDSASELVDALSKLADKRGLPVLFPLMDLEDQQQFSTWDIRQMNLQNLSVAAARYAPDALLVGSVQERPGKGWLANWQAQFSGKQFSWQFKAKELNGILDQAMQQTAQLLASDYALQSGLSQDQTVMLDVDQMTGLASHVQVLRYLQSLDAVESARPVLFDQDRVLYRVRLRNSSDDLSRLIALGSMLEQLDLPQIDATTDEQIVRMNYRLIGQ